MNRTARKKELLKTLVELYIASGRPVSSARVAQEVQTVSAATIRGDMKRLTEAGYLEQPHRSAGRVPTQAGIRAYLDADLNPRLHPWDRAHLDSAVTGEVGEVSVRLSQRLARMTNQMAVVGLARFAGSSFREVGLAPCGNKKFVAYFVSPGGRVQQKVFELDYELSPTQCQYIINVLNDRLTHRSLREVRDLLQQELQKERLAQNKTRRLALEIGLRALPEPEMELVVEGTAHLAQQPEFSNSDKLQTVLRGVENKRALAQVLDRILEGPGVTVVLGGEHHVEEITDLACVGLGFVGVAGDRRAVITVMGPTRMDYRRLVALVAHAASLLKRSLSRF